MPLIFAFTLWFGLYLVSRNRLFFAGVGLISYSLCIALTILLTDYPQLASLRAAVLLLPALCWLGATLHLFPDVPPHTNTVIGLTAMIAFTLVLVEPATHALIAPLVTFVSCLIAAISIFRAFRYPLPRPPMIILAAATLFFSLGMTLLLLPVHWLNHQLSLSAIGVDLLLLGYAVALFDAYSEGTRLLPDALRSLASAVVMVVIFGGQVMLLTGQPLLLLTVITSAVVWSTLSEPLQNVLDKLMLPTLQEQRQMLRDVNEAIPRVDETFDFATVEDAEFDKLTRKALSYYNDLNKLASSPLTQLPAVTSRLSNRPDGILERSGELKALLKECVMQLKPLSDDEFGTTDEWRYYNVLYFPYVLGIKPYNRRADSGDLPPSLRPVLNWFQTQVPERTLYNWQTTAARLVAQKLREMSKLAAVGSD